MKHLTKSSFIFAILGAITIFASLFSFAPQVVKADNYTPDSNSTVDVVALDKNGGSVAGTRFTAFDDNALSQYNWEDVSKFRLSFNIDEADLKLATPVEEYKYHVKVEYVNKYTNDMLATAEDPSFDQAATIQSYNLPSKTVTSLSSISTQEIVVSNIKDSINTENDKTRSVSSEDKQCYGWGVYRFSIVFENINKTFYSFYQSLKPTPLLENPTIDYTITSSNTSLKNAYNFFLTNEDIDFIDSSSITWYVEGESTTGKKYVLTESDINENFGNSLYNTADKLARRGKTFYFDSNNISGKWQVYCVVNNYGDEEAKISERVEVETGTRISTSTIIWFIVGGVVLLAIIIVIIIVVTKKKEKVW